MDLLPTTYGTLQQNPTMCRFCAAPFSNDDSSKISINKQFTNCTEINEELLKETFDVQLSRRITTSKLICAECGKRLHDAHLFKILVLSSEERLLKVYQGKIEEEEAPVMKMEAFPLEDTQQEDTNDQDLGESHGDGDLDDNELLADIKLEIPKRRQNKLISPKDKLNHDKDWTKLIDRRGNGPILRENSLKLISNSTLCPFQWNKSRYRCYCCNQPYSDMNILREHMKEHKLQEIEKKIIAQQNKLVKVEVSVLSCKICRLEINCLEELRNHLHKHGINFNKQEDLLVPFRIDKSVLNCQICDETFTVFRLLNIHMNRHFQKQVCDICGAGFSNSVFLNMHKYRAHKPIKCKSCNLTFTKRIEKRNHDLATHGLTLKTKKQRFPCPYCTERFVQENQRVLHLVDKHKFDKPEHKCVLCPKVFVTRSLCNNHVKNVHMKEKKHECEICHHMFYTKSDLARHKVTHTGEKKYSCNVCGSRFGTKDSLRKHTKRAHI